MLPNKNFASTFSPPPLPLPLPLFLSMKQLYYAKTNLLWLWFRRGRSVGGGHFLKGLFDVTLRHFLQLWFIQESDLS